METPKQQLNSCPCRMTSHLRNVSRCSNPSVGWVVGPSGSRSPASAAGSCPRPVDAFRGRASPAGARSRARERARHGRRGTQPGLWPGASDPVLGNGHAHKGSLRSARTGICGPHAPAGLKPIADPIRKLRPCGSLNPEGRNKRGETPEETHVVRLIHPTAEPAPVPIDRRAAGISRRSGSAGTWMARHRWPPSHHWPRFGRPV